MILTMLRCAWLNLKRDRVVLLLTFVLPVAFMLPCVIIMILVGLMGFELIQSSTGYKQAGFITRTFGEILGQKVK